MQRAIVAVCGEALPPGPLPAQLRFVEPAVLRGLVGDAGFEAVEIVTLEGALVAASA